MWEYLIPLLLLAGAVAFVVLLFSRSKGGT
jgi:hypothetical protein